MITQGKGLVFIYVKVRQNRKADWRSVDSPKKRTNEFDLFAVKSKKSKQIKIVRLGFWEKLAESKLLLRLTDL